MSIGKKFIEALSSILTSDDATSVEGQSQHDYSEKDKRDAFDKFQLEEYKNISTSHYETVKQISLFFRYYLLVLAALPFVISLVGKDETGFNQLLNGEKSEAVYITIIAYTTFIAITGLLLFLYIVNLRHDAILYAHTVNKVRKYFYLNSHLKIEEIDQYVNLPFTTTKPQYIDKTFFLPLVLFFVFINSGLLCGALVLASTKGKYLYEWCFSFDFPLNFFSISIITFVFGAIHGFLFIYLSKRRDNYHLKYLAFGIDIDGVTNHQTQHFVSWLYKLTGKKIEATDIKEIPVRLNNKLNVSDYDEKLVFATREYWETIPVRENANIRINEIHRSFGYKIVLFTYRDWPQYLPGKEEEMKKFIQSKGLHPLDKNDIKLVTRKWLNDNLHFTEKKWYDFFGQKIKCWLDEHIGERALVYEKGNPYVSDSRLSKTINRFHGTKRYRLRFFIEDHPENAIKLSNYCEYVFLFDEPYNQAEAYDFPKNVLRVYNWNDIYRHLKRLS